MIKLYKSSSKILKYALTLIPDGTEVVGAYYTVKSDASISDAEAEIFKSITNTPNDDGAIIDSGADDNTGYVEFYVSPTDAHNMETGRYYFGCVKVLLDNDEMYILEDSIESVRVFNAGITL